MNSDIKALLTLWLLKTGTGSQEIRTVLQLAATSRMMAAEERADRSLDEDGPQAAGNVAKLRSEASAAAASEEMQNLRAVNSDIKALLSLSLLKIGATANEIQSAMRLASASRASATTTTATATAERAEPSRTVRQAELENRPAEVVSMTAKQALRNDHLAPISMREFAAA
jgi:hypothetical protein